MQTSTPHLLERFIKQIKCICECFSPNFSRGEMILSGLDEYIKKKLWQTDALLSIQRAMLFYYIYSVHLFWQIICWFVCQFGQNKKKRITDNNLFTSFNIPNGFQFRLQINAATNDRIDIIDIIDVVSEKSNVKSLEVPLLSCSLADSRRRSSVIRRCQRMSDE